jgi:hypothetical protein
MSVRSILAFCLMGVLTTSGASLAGSASTSGAGSIGSGSTTAASPASADLESVLRLVATAYGGADALAAVSGFRATGKILSLADGVNGRIRMVVDLSGRMRTEIDYPSTHEVRILSHRLAWNGGVDAQNSSSPAMASSMRLQYHRLAAPFELVTTAHAALESIEPSDEGWTRVQRRWEDGSVTTYEIDPDHGWITRVRGEIVADGDPLEFVTESADFREVEGVMFPFRMTTVVAGQVAAETILDRIRIDSEFVAEDFLPAGSTGDI